MARLRIDLPDAWAFTTQLPLYIEHINYGQHLDNARLLGLVSEARVRWLASLGYSEGDVAGVALMVADQAVRYVSQAGAGETMVVSLAVGEITRAGFGLVWRMDAQGDGREVARGTTGMVCFDYREQRVRAVPDAFRARIAGTG